MRRLWTTIALGILGLAFAVLLSLGAFALAGRSIDEPIAPIAVHGSPARSSQSAGAHHTPSPSDDPSKGPDGDGSSPAGAPSPSEAPSPIDNRGTPSPDGSEPGDDHEGSGHGGDD